MNVLRESLPQSIDVAALGVRSKAPYQLLCTREAVIWRTEELARTACDALEGDDFAAAAILTRAVTENAAMTWSLLEVLETRGKYDPEQLNELLMRLLAGSKIWPELPKPVHVLDLVRKIDKTVTGIMASYDRLSEFVHPNWSGVAGLYSKIDQKNFVTYFGRGLRNADSSRDMIANALLGSLGAFEYAYNRISDLMPVFIGELESLWSDKGEA
ncbi:hypothetical protein AB9E29_18225 [Rhizobium leguminosarum]|uniref:hypothetical protein n=1 Tax=Rhizobium leguminosarum TaxID=384 RepID=UPI003F97E218